jgi:hypothetical protein
MMTNPGDYLAVFRKADRCTIHVEVGGTAELLAGARKLGLRTGVAGCLEAGRGRRPCRQTQPGLADGFEALDLVPKGRPSQVDLFRASKRFLRRHQSSPR